MFSLGTVVLSGLLGSAMALPPPSLVFYKRTTNVVANSPAAVYSINNNDGIGAGSNNYVYYSGDGSTGAGWPAMSDWVSFDDMFNNNKYNMQNGCEDGIPQNSDQEIGDIYNAIQQIAAQSKVDHRYILAEILQESTGCVRVQTTKAPEGNIYNPGLMQDFDGYYTCNCEQNDEYNENCGLVNPCPQATITGMIQEGVQGTNAGDGLAALINQAQSQGSSGAQTFYIASEWYNQGSGSPPVGGNLGTYAQNIANRLTGWTN